MDYPMIAGHGHRHSCFLESLAVAFILIPQSIVLGSDDERSWQSSEIWSEPRGGQGILLVLFTIQGLVREPVLALFGKVAVSARICFDGRCIPPEVEIRIDQ